MRMMKKATNPHFFKVILSDSLSQGKLVIPRTFVKRYRTYLSDKVFLKVPTGSKWQVELERNSECICFGNGWPQFVDYYSISHGSFLVFGLEISETCCLNVLIFDKSASEIDYPLHEEQNPEKNLHEKAAFQIAENNIVAFNEPSSRSHPNRSAKRKHSLTNDAKPSPAKRATTSYKSNNPSFSITMRQTHVYEKCILTVPISFATQYFTERRGNINLSSVDGKTWPAGYVNFRATSGGKLTRIVRGWRKFVLDNHLAVGDVCVFELINGNANDLKVSILKAGGNAEIIPSTEIDYPFHEEQNPKENLREKAALQIAENDRDVSDEPSNRCHPNRSAKRKHSLTNEATLGPVKRETTSYKSKNPSFSITMRQTHVYENCSLTVPVSFATHYFTEQQGNINPSSADGQTWSAGYISSRATGRRKLTRIIRGWRKYVLDNHLAAGDVCVFELINGNTNELKVAIQRMRRNVKGKQSNSKTTWNPSFKVILSQSHFQARYLALPGRFMQICKNRGADKSMFVVNNKTRGPHEAKLQVGARVWPVSCSAIHRVDHFNFRRVFWVFLRTTIFELEMLVCLSSLIPTLFRLRFPFFLNIE